MAEEAHPCACRGRHRYAGARFIHHLAKIKWHLRYINKGAAGQELRGARGSRREHNKRLDTFPRNG